MEQTAAERDRISPRLSTYLAGVCRRPVHATSLGGMEGRADFSRSLDVMVGHELGTGVVGDDEFVGMVLLVARKCLFRAEKALE